MPKFLLRIPAVLLSSALASAPLESAGAHRQASPATCASIQPGTTMGSQAVVQPLLASGVILRTLSQGRQIAATWGRLRRGLVTVQAVPSYAHDRHLLGIPRGQFGNPKRAIDFREVESAAASNEAAQAMGWPAHQEVDAESKAYWRGLAALDDDERAEDRRDAYLLRLLKEDRIVYGLTPDQTLMLLGRARLAMDKRTAILNPVAIRKTLARFPHQRYTLRRTSLNGPIELEPELNGDRPSLQIFLPDGTQIYGRTSIEVKRSMMKAFRRAKRVILSREYGIFQKPDPARNGWMYPVRFELRDTHDYAAEEDQGSVIIQRHALANKFALILVQIEELLHAKTGKPDDHVTEEAIRRYLTYGFRISRQATLEGLVHLGIASAFLTETVDLAEKFLESEFQNFKKQYQQTYFHLAFEDDITLRHVIHAWEIQSLIAQALAFYMHEQRKGDLRAQHRNLLGIAS